MKILLLISITFIINISLINKGSSEFNSVHRATDLTEIVGTGNVLTIYSKGLNYINQARKQLIKNISNYSYNFIALIFDNKEINKEIYNDKAVIHNPQAIGDSTEHKQLIKGSTCID